VTGNDGVVYATFSSYAANDQPRTVVRPATTSAYEFDGWTGNLKAIRAANAAGNLVNLELAFTHGGRVSSVNDLVAGELRAYSYDGMGRLKVERSTVASAIPSLLFWPDALRPHALQSVTTPSANYEFMHDANGNVLTGYDVANSGSPQLRTFQYDTGALFDFLSMPAAITRSPGSPVEMLYDHAGVRARKGTGAGAVYYIGPHFEVRDGAYTKHVIADGVRLATISGGQTFHFYKDHRGSTVAATDPQGTSVWSGRYTSFGALLGESGVRPTPYLFTDHELDGETGLYYFGARYYDPAVGRFTSPDSMVPEPFAPQSLNRYAYVRNDPLSRVDPDGHADGEICQRYGGGACEGNGGGGGGGGGVDIPGWGDGTNWQPPPGLLNPPGVPGIPGVVYPSGPAAAPPPNLTVPVRGIGVSGGGGGPAATVPTNSGRYWLLDVSDFFAGMGSVLSFGLTDWINDATGASSVVNRGSGWFTAGQLTGLGVSTVIGGAVGGGRALALRGMPGAEFSHFIPARTLLKMGLGQGRSILNGNYVRIAKHALNDPMRYHFMPGGWKALNAINPLVVRIWDRAPMLLIGAAAGAGYGSASMALSNAKWDWDPDW
jgi:RHS repeat-associated protein